jgi:hypothetical protein
MWKELAIIILVIAVSYVFTISDKKYFDNQLMFIIAILLILVIYKSMHYYSIINDNKQLINQGQIKTQNVEKFTDIDLTKVSAWLSTTQNKASGMTIEQQAALASDYSSIRQDLENVKKLLQGLNAQQSAQASQATASPESTYDRPSMLNLASLQTMQSEKLDNLKKEIDKAKGTLTQVTMLQNVKDYPKIPVYSSCVVADANGGYTTNSSGANASSTSSGFSNITPSPVVNNGILTQAISGLLSGGVNINVSS